MRTVSALPWEVCIILEWANAGIDALTANEGIANPEVIIVIINKARNSRMYKRPDLKDIIGRTPMRHYSL